MIFHYDLSQAEPIVRDMPVYGTSDILRGALLSREGAISTAENNFGLQLCSATVMDDVVGVAEEFYDYDKHINNAGVNGVTAVATGVTNYIKVIINPMAVYLAEWSQAAANDVVNTVASSTGKTTTGTFTSPGDDVEGDWVYYTNVGSTAGGAGNLYQIGAASTTEWTATTSFDDDMKATTTSDTYIKLLHPVFATVAGGSMSLSAAAGEINTHVLGNDVVGDDTGPAIVLQNYVTDKAHSLEPLRVERHSGKNFDAATCHLYCDFYPLDHLLRTSGTLTASPVVT
jgi:hypothetical protein